MSSTQVTSKPQRMSEEAQSDSEIENTSLGSTPSSFDDFHRWQAHIGLKNFGDGLHAAAQAIFPSESGSQYSKVYVLMLCWENETPDQPLPIDIGRLFKVFEGVYHFATEVWRIPNENSQVEIDQRILDFVSLGCYSY